MRLFDSPLAERPAAWDVPGERPRAAAAGEHREDETAAEDDAT